MFISLFLVVYSYHCSDFSEHYSKMAFMNKDLTVYAPGEIIVARWTDGKWYRAKVIEADPDNKRVKVTVSHSLLVSKSDVAIIERVLLDQFFEKKPDLYHSVGFVVFFLYFSLFSIYSL